MPKEKNPPIGEMQCAFRDCECKASVYRYRERSSDETKRRFAGRVYACCERKHRCEDQDFILENATIWGASKSAGAAPAPAAVGPVKTSEKAASPPVRKAPEPKRPAPVDTTTPVMTVVKDIPGRTVPTLAAARKASWGYFE